MASPLHFSNGRFKNLLTLSAHAGVWVGGLHLDSTASSWKLGLYGRRLCPKFCAKTLHLWRMTFFAQLVSHLTKLISFESLSATLLRPSNADSFVRHWLGEEEIEPTPPMYLAFRSAPCATSFTYTNVSVSAYLNQAEGWSTAAVVATFTS